MGLGNIIKETASAVADSFNARTAPAKKIEKEKVKKAAEKKKPKKPLANVPNECFLVEIQENGNVHHILNTGLEIPKMKELACEIDIEYLQSHLPRVPPGWHWATDSELHCLETDDGVYPTFMRIGIETVIRLGLLEKLVRKQEIVLSPGFKERLNACLPPEQRGTAYFEMGMTSSTGGGNYNVGLGPIARGGFKSGSFYIQDPLVIEYLDLDMEIANAAVEYAMPEKTKNMVKRHNEIDASMNHGSLDSSRLVSSVQLNSSKHTDRRLVHLSRFGRLHVDGGDDPLSWTVMTILSHLPENYYPGTFLMPSLKLACIAAPFEILVFQGGMPHVCRGLGPYDVPEESPLRYKAPAGVVVPRPDHERWQRVTDPTYAKKTLTRPGNLPKPEVLSRACLQAHWKTEARRRTWEMEFYIKRNEMLKMPARIPVKKPAKTPAKTPVKAPAKTVEKKPPGEGKFKAFSEKVDGKMVELSFTLPTSYQVLDPEQVVKLFPWVDEVTQEICYPSVETAKLCLEGHQERDDDWEDAKAITSACCFGFDATQEVKDRRKSEEEDYSLRVATFERLNQRRLALYREYEAAGLVKPVGLPGTKVTGLGSLKRGQLEEEYRVGPRINEPKLSLDPEVRKQARKAKNLGLAMNRVEKYEREEHFLYPARFKNYDNSCIVLSEQITGLSISGEVDKVEEDE